MDPVLLVGGAGYIGSHTAKYLAQQGFLPVVYDDLSRGHREAVKWGPLEVGDIVEFIVYEASSKEDTPPFCRMLGQRILSVEPQEDGGLLIRVQRAR